MAEWPTSLPESLNVDGYAEVRADGTLRTQMDAGPEFVRRRFSAVPVRVSGNLVLTKTQVATLDSFYASTLNGGVDAFDWFHPRTGVSVEMRFLSPPAYRAFSDDLWQADLAFEIQP